jgi:hypothetical protein
VRVVYFTTVLSGVFGFSWIWIMLLFGSAVGFLIRLLGYYGISRIRYRSEPKYKEVYLLEFEGKLRE